MFLDLLLEDDCQARLRDNTTRKKKVFAELAKVLQEAGFRLPSGADGINKVDQKYRNLERCYKNFVQYTKLTGVEKKDAPEFYDQLHALFGTKHTVNPVSLCDSLDTEPVVPSSDDSTIDIATSTVTGPSLSSGTCSLGRDRRRNSSFSRGSFESCCSETSSCSSVSESDFSSPPAKPLKKKKWIKAV